MSWDLSNESNYKEQSTGVIIGVLVGALTVGGILYFVFFTKPVEPVADIKWEDNYQLTNNQANMDNPTAVPSTNNLIIEVLKPGSGEASTNGQKVAVHYTGWLTSGQKFDSSLDRGQPFEFTLGARQVIPGWDEGVLGMKIGEKRKLTIPANLGYGAQGAGEVIPPNATLIFEVELLAIN